MTLTYPTPQEVEVATGGRYHIEKLYASGGMGAVYLGRHKKLDSPVAVKVLPPHLALGEVQLARFKREAALAANLSHPNIVPVFEFDVTDDLAYLVMPFVEGEDLRSILDREGSLGWEETIKMLREIGSGLSFAHAREVIHRDIKPQNILRERDTGRWLLTDFGIARHVTEADDITATRAYVGTPAYMAPEQQTSSRDVDARADLYALATVAFETLTGEKPDRNAPPERLAKYLSQKTKGRSSRISNALVAPLDLSRERRPTDVKSWLDSLSQPRVRARRIKWSILAAAFSILVVAAWWFSRGEAPAASDRPRIAVLPFEVSGPSFGLSLDSLLPQALVWQLRMLPDHEVLGAPLVQSRIRDRFGDTPQPLDTLLASLARGLGARLAVSGRAQVLPDSTLVLDIQVRETTGSEVIARAEASGSIEELHNLIARLVVDAFATRIARQRVGWSEPSLPKGIPAISAYFQGDRLFRSGNYPAAIERFDEVIRQDSTFGLAYLKRMLAEVLRRPTQATIQLRTAFLEGSPHFSLDVDPASKRLIEAWETLIREGDVAQAEQSIAAIGRQYPLAVDAWFTLGLLRFHFGVLMGQPVTAARPAFEQAQARDPSFAAPLLYLITFAHWQGDESRTREYMDDYLALDSTSVRASLVRAADTLLFRPEHAPRVLRSFPERPVEFLEDLAFLTVAFGRRGAERAFGRRAVEVIWERPGVGSDRDRAFRLRMSNLLGMGRNRAAAELIREGVRSGVSQREIDRWLLLSAITELPPLGNAQATSRAADRLREDAGDPIVSRWLWIRWLDVQGRTSEARASGDGLRAEVAADPAPIPLDRSLAEDLRSRELLERGDTLGAISLLETATSRFNVETVPFGILSSLWPLRIQLAQLYRATERHDQVIRVSESFENISAFVDQVGWPTILLLRGEAAEATGDLDLAIDTYIRILEVLTQPEGAAAETVRQANVALERLSPNPQ